MGTGERRGRDSVKTRIIAPAEGLPGLPPPSDSDSYSISDSLSNSCDSSDISSGSDVSSPRRGRQVRRRSPSPAVDKGGSLKERDMSPERREQNTKRRARHEDEDYHRRQRTQSPRRRSPSPRRPSPPPRRHGISHKRPATHSRSPSPSRKRPLIDRYGEGKERNEAFVKGEVRIRGREKDDSNKGGVEGAGKGGSGSQVVNGRVAVSIAPRKGGERRQSGGDAESEKEDKQETEKDKIFTGIDDKAEKEGGVETRGPTQEAEDLEDPPLDVDVPAEATHGKSEEGEMEIGGEAIGAVNGGTSEGVAEDLSGLGAQQEEPEEEELNRKNEAEVADAQKERKSSRWDRKASQEIGEEGEIGIYLEAGTADDQKVKESNDAQQGGGAFDRTEGERFERRGNDRRFEERGQDERRGEAERFEKGGENERFERKGDDRHENRRRDESYGDDRRRDERYDRGPDRYERPRDGRFDDPRQRRDDRYDDGRSRDRRVGDRGDRFGGERENERRSDDRRRTERDYARLDDRRYEGRGYGDRGNQDRGYDGRGPERSRREDRTEQNGRLNFEERERGREPAAKAAPYERPETMQADREERVRSSGRAGWGAQRGGSFKQPTEKWGHDKFNELNQGNEVGEVVEEDPYAKIEALLAL